MAKELCKGGAILNMLKGIRNWSDKIEFVEDAITDCAPKPKKVKGNGKAKRAMSGYNCYMRHCAKKTGNFGTCLTDRGWAKLSEDEKQQYNGMATEGCNVE